MPTRLPGSPTADVIASHSESRLAQRRSCPAAVTSTSAASHRPNKYNSNSPGLPRSRDRLPAAYPSNVVGPVPCRLEADTSQPSRQQPSPSGDIAKQRSVFAGRQRPRAAAVRSAHVLVMDEELVEVRKATHPSKTEKPAGGPRRMVSTRSSNSVPVTNATRRRSANRPHHRRAQDPARQQHRVHATPDARRDRASSTIPAALGPPNASSSYRSQSWARS